MWRRPEIQRWDRKPLTEMNGEPWNTPPRQEEMLQIQDTECIALKQQIKCGGQKRSITCCGRAGSNSWDLRARTQDIVDNEVAQTDRASSNSPGKPPHDLSDGTMQISIGGTAMAAGRPAPEDSHMMAAAVAESSTTQSTTSSTIRVVDTEGPSNTECQKVLASRSDRHGTTADMDTCRAVVLTTDPEDCDGWTRQVVDWNKKCRGAKSGHLGHLFESQKVSERRIKELANIEKLEVAEITLQEARAQASEIVCARWLDNVARTTLEDPAAVRSREDATQVNASDHKDEVQATTPITAPRIILSMAATKVIVRTKFCAGTQYERKSDSRNELKNIHLRVLLLHIHIHRAPAAVRAAVPVPVPAAV